MPLNKPARSGREESQLQRAQEGICNDALKVAKPLEAGLAQQPLSSAFEGLARAPKKAPIKALLLGVSPSDTAKALALFLGIEEEMAVEMIPDANASVDFVLESEKFSITQDGSSTVVESADLLVEQVATLLKATSEKDDAVSQKFKLHWPAGEAREGLHLIVPGSLQYLIKHPVLWSALVEETDWLFLSAPKDWTPEATEKEYLQMIMDESVGLQCLVHSEGSEAASPLPTQGWWTGWKVACGFSPLACPMSASAMDRCLSTFSPSGSELSRYVQESARQRNIEAHWMLLNEELEQQNRNILSQKKLQQAGLLDSSDKDPAIKRDADRAKESFQAGIETLRRNLDKEVKRQLAPGGQITQVLEEAANQIEPADIEQEEAGPVIKFTLNSEVKARLVETVEQLCRERIGTDLVYVQEHLKSISGSLKTSLQGGCSIRFEPKLPSLNAETIWSSVMGLARPDIRYRGEMPRPTVGARLGKARQGIFGILMFGMILGAIGTLLGESNNIRTYLYAAMLPLLIIGFFYTYVSFKKQEGIVLDKEVEKLREGAARELRRAAGDLLKEELNSINQLLQTFARSVPSELARELQKKDEELQKERRQAVQSGREKERALDQRLRQMEQHTRLVKSLEERMAKSKDVLELWLRGWVDRLNKPQ